MGNNFTVVYDANVLYPAPIRDLLMELAKTGLFRAKWTDKITDEWVRNLLINRKDIEKEALEITTTLMTDAVPDCLVTDYEFMIPGLPLTSKDDRHVLAAAIKSQAQVIVTYNLKDFPTSELHPFDVEAKHPDDFLQDCYELHQPTVLGAVQNVLGRLKNPTMSAQELLDNYRDNHGLVVTASRLEEVIHLLGG